LDPSSVNQRDDWTRWPWIHGRIFCLLLVPPNWRWYICPPGLIHQLAVYIGKYYYMCLVSVTSPLLPIQRTTERKYLPMRGNRLD
jgi:hypothetical protein